LRRDTAADRFYNRAGAERFGHWMIGSGVTSVIRTA
jgi:hypothetical protein